MNSLSKINYPRFLAVAAVLASVLVAGTYAYGELKDYSGIEGRDYHAMMYKRGNCAACHETDKPAGYPEDGACLQCHSLEDVVAATMPEAEEDRWQNPHDSLHYGQDVPCGECHGEHSNKAPLCADCHNFDYPDHQY